MPTPALCCPPPGPGLHPRPTPETRTPCDTTPQVRLDECTQAFQAALTAEVVSAIEASGGAAPSGTSAVTQAVLHEGATTFIRTTRYANDGSVSSVDDRLLDGTPYAVVSAAAVEAGPAEAPTVQAVDTLRQLGQALQLSLSGVSTRVALGAGVTAVSIEAVGGPVRFAVGDAAVVADAATSHYIGEGTVKDFRVPPGAHIAAVQATGSTATALEISELLF